MHGQPVFQVCVTVVGNALAAISGRRRTSVARNLFRLCVGFWPSLFVVVVYPVAHQRYWLLSHHNAVDIADCICFELDASEHRKRNPTTQSQSC